jgi:biotin carboxyl carrier protein
MVFAFVLVGGFLAWLNQRARSEELAVVEAMKMENSLRAVEDVTIAKVLANEGESLVVDQPILTFD